MTSVNYYKYKTYLEYINYSVALLIAFCFPIFKRIIPALIAVWLLTWILEFNFKNRFTVKNKIALLALVLFSFYNAMSFFYSTNKFEALFDIEVKLTLLIFPLTFIGVNSLYKKNINKLLGIFIAGNLIASLACLAIAFYNSINIGSTGFSFAPHYFDENGVLLNHFFYTSFSKFVHSGYFSLYLVFSLIIIFHFLNENIIAKNRTYPYVLILIFLITIYLLSSKMGLLTAIAVLVFQLAFYLYKKTNKLTILFLVSIIALFSFLVVKYNARMNFSYQQLHNTNFNKNKLNTSEDRMKIWYYSLDILKENVWFGVGSGDIQDKLNEVYKKYNYEKALGKNLNCHNQYLETLISNGILGLVLLLAVFLAAFIPALKQKNYLLGLFLFVTAANFMFETMLNTQAGVIFFAFFYSLIVFVDNKSSEKTMAFKPYRK